MEEVSQSIAKDKEKMDFQNKGCWQNKAFGTDFVQTTKQRLASVCMVILKEASEEREEEFTGV